MDEPEQAAEPDAGAEPDAEAEPDAGAEHDLHGAGAETEPEGGPRREAADRLLAAHGAVVYRYCAAMVDDVGLATVLPTVFGHVEERLAELGDADEESARQTLQAVAYNRCIQHGRTGGAAPGGEGLDRERARVIEALARLRPVGRGVLLLRVVFGLRWSEMGRVCGLPRLRLLRRSCRAWRRMAALTGSAATGADDDIGNRPRGEPLSEDPAAWAAIRADARRFVAIREAIRRTYVDRPAPEGWRAEVWRRLDEQRDEARRQAEQREAERRAEHEARRQARQGSSDSEPPHSEPAAAGPFWHEDDDPDEAEAASPRRSMPWRWLAVGVVLAVVSLAARWLLLR